MHTFKSVTCSALCGLCATLFVQHTVAQTAPIIDVVVPNHVASGSHQNTSMKTRTVYSHLMRMDKASSFQIQFGRTTLPQGTMIRMTSLQDGAMQHHTATTLKQWQHKSAWFNGSMVLIELIAEPNTSSTHFTIDAIIIIEQIGDERSICGPTDDRELSYEDRDARALPVGCTAWIIDDANHQFLTAGHCSDGNAANIATIEFNVPESDSSGNIQHPGPEDQYASDPESLQYGYSGIGDDWTYFGCFPNTETGLTAFQAQNDYYILSDVAPPVGNQQITICGYGTTSSPVPPSYNQAQKIHTGPYAVQDGTSIGYVTDTSGGNSGSAVFNEETGEAIGIHTNGGCSSGNNWGCGIHNTGLQTALANPTGVCVPNILHFNFPNTLPYDVLPNSPTLIQFNLTAGAENPVPDLVKLVLIINGDQSILDIDWLGEDMYEVTLPGFNCDDDVSYYFKAQSDEGTLVYSPYGAPTDRYDIVVGAIVNELILTEGFDDGIPSGWSVSGLWDANTSCLPDYDGECDGGIAAYFGDTSNCNYDTGDTVSGSLMTPVISLDGYVGDLILSFCSAVETENLDSYDKTDVYVNGILYASIDESYDWQLVELKLSEITGDTIQIEWRFDSEDSLYNDFRGWHVDGVQLVAQTVECDDSGDCPEDISGDGEVNVSDILMVIDQWNQTNSPADVNGDGVVNITDLLAIVGNWGPCT